MLKIDSIWLLTSVLTRDRAVHNGDPFYVSTKSDTELRQLSIEDTIVRFRVV